MKLSSPFLVAVAATNLALGEPEGTPCPTHTFATEPPSKTQVALQKYSYCSGIFEASAYIENIAYDKVVTVYFTDADGKENPLTALQLNYQKSVSDSNYEVWAGSASQLASSDIGKLLNLTFEATKLDETYTETLNLQVDKSGPPAPPPKPLPKPYASPSGFAPDITVWLEPLPGFTTTRAKYLMFQNIEVTDAIPGTSIAAQSYDNPDYAYNWVRDSSLTFDVVVSMYKSVTSRRMRTLYEGIIFRYAGARNSEQHDPNLQTGLGEPKFYLNGSVYGGPWGRPQNDGPATSAITLIEFAEAFLSRGGSLQKVRSDIWQKSVLADLHFVAKNWTSTSFDIWEEEASTHFYTRMVQHRALSLGASFAEKMGDSKDAALFQSQAGNIASEMPAFWNKARGIILYELGPVLRGKSSYLDTAVLLGLIHGYNDDQIFNYNNDKVLATAVRLTVSFIDIYGIAGRHFDDHGLVLGTPIGRYPEDVYDGVNGNSLGNPWYLTTSAMAEVMYRSSMAFEKQGFIEVSETSLPFWNYFAPRVHVQTGKKYSRWSREFHDLIDAQRGWGDAFLRTVRYYMAPGDHMSEEFNRNSGEPNGAIDLTWSYASLLTAAMARAQARDDGFFSNGSANFYVTTNVTSH